MWSKSGGEKTEQGRKDQKRGWGPNYGPNGWGRRNMASTGARAKLKVHFSGRTQPEAARTRSWVTKKARSGGGSEKRKFFNKVMPEIKGHHKERNSTGQKKNKFEGRVEKKQSTK